ncbi:hypothetical protein ABES08_16400 [Peribacillus simplex]|uniref:hypothetical protein n=1 Tax=Peribacillus simplex TaxID=1478 RepID=UPI003D2C90D7
MTFALVSTIAIGGENDEIIQVRFKGILARLTRIYAAYFSVLALGVGFCLIMGQFVLTESHYS